MPSDFRRGFKKHAEDLALQVRSDIGLGHGDRLNPRELAGHAGVPVFELEELAQEGMATSSIRHLLGDGRREFSAAMIQKGDKRLIVANTSHSSARQASNIVHELSHLLLEHEAPAAVLEAGCRRWNSTMEREADWLAGELLVPRRAALEVARDQLDPGTAARHFGVSELMMKWRLNHSGARKQAERERAALNRRSR